MKNAIFLVTLTMALLGLSMPQRASAQSLANPDFEGAYNPVGSPQGSVVTGSVANGWSDNSWQTGIAIDYSPDTATKHNGATSQKIAVSSGYAQFVQWINFQAGSTACSVWMKAQSPMTVTLYLRQGGAPYAIYGTTTVKLGTGWNQVLVTGYTPAVSGGIFINTQGTGTFWVDDAAYASFASNVTNPSCETFTALNGNPNITGQVATGWQENTAWNSGSRITYSQDTSEYHSGASSQKIVIGGNGYIQVKIPYTFPKGTAAVSVWMKAASPMGVLLSVRDDTTYQYVSSVNLLVGTGWTQVVARGAARNGCSVWIETFKTGTLWLDDASVTTGVGWGIIPPTTAIPATYFGLHPHGTTVGGLANGVPWPTFNFPLVRNNGGTFDGDVLHSWAGVEPTAPVNGVHTYRWTQNDVYVNNALSKNEKIIWTIFQTPAWATSSTATDAWGQVGANGFPDKDPNFTNFRAFCTALATRYKGKVYAYEMWNEPDGQGYWLGTPAQMAAMTQAGVAAIRAADPNALLISPSITDTSFLNDFIGAGGAVNLDVLAFHPYGGDRDAEVLTGIQSVQAQYGLQLPVWNTESGSYSKTADTVATTMGVLGGEYVMNWAAGIPVFCWYNWAADSNVGPGTQGETAYQLMMNWLIGATMQSVTVDGNGTWVCQMQNGGVNQWILWNNLQNITYAVPAGWGVTETRDLYNATTGAVSTVALGPTSSRGGSPILLIAPSGSYLSGSVTTGSGVVNLTTLGTSDWAHWGHRGVTMNRKATGGSQIASTLPSGATRYTNNGVGFTWTGGTPTSAVTNTKTGVYVTNGTFTITAPASTTSRTLNLYVGGSQSTGNLTASLSDGSASVYTDTRSNASGNFYQVYTLNYKAASANQTLTVTWRQTAGSGNVTLQAAALQ